MNSLAETKIIIYINLTGLFLFIEGIKIKYLTTDGAIKQCAGQHTAVTISQFILYAYAGLFKVMLASHFPRIYDPGNNDKEGF